MRHCVQYVYVCRLEGGVRMSVHIDKERPGGPMIWQGLVVVVPAPGFLLLMILPGQAQATPPRPPQQHYHHTQLYLVQAVSSGLNCSAKAKQNLGLASATSDGSSPRLAAIIIPALSLLQR